MEQLSMLSACPGFYHNATVSLRCPSAPKGPCALRVAVDGNPMQPLLDGMPLKQGGTLPLTTTDKQPDSQKVVPRPGFLGLVSSNGHAPAVKVNFRNLSVSSHGALPAPAAGGPEWGGLAPPGGPWTIANTPGWPAVSSFPGGNWVADPRRNGDIIVFYNGKLVRSRDGGRSFPDAVSGAQAPSIPTDLGPQCTGWIGDDGSLACYVLSPSGTGAIHPGQLYKATAPSFGANWTAARAVHNVSFPADVSWRCSLDLSCCSSRQLTKFTVAQWMPAGIPTNLSTSAALPLQPACACWVWVHNARVCPVWPGCRSWRASSA